MLRVAAQLPDLVVDLLDVRLAAGRLDHLARRSRGSARSARALISSGQHHDGSVAHPRGPPTRRRCRSCRSTGQTARVLAGRQSARTAAFSIRHGIRRADLVRAGREVAPEHHRDGRVHAGQRLRQHHVDRSSVRLPGDVEEVDRVERASPGPPGPARGCPGRPARVAHLGEGGAEHVGGRAHCATIPESPASRPLGSRPSASRFAQGNVGRRAGDPAAPKPPPPFLRRTDETPDPPRPGRRDAPGVRLWSVCSGRELPAVAHRFARGNWPENSRRRRRLRWRPGTRGWSSTWC